MCIRAVHTTSIAFNFKSVAFISFRELTIFVVCSTLYSFFAKQTNNINVSYHRIEPLDKSPSRPLKEKTILSQARFYNQ